MRWASIACLLAALAACGPEQQLIPATQVIVRVEGSRELRARVDAVRVRITRSEGGAWSEAKSMRYAAGAWPMDLVLVLDEGSVAALFEVVIEALDEAGEVLTQERKLARFEPRRVLLLELALQPCGTRELGFVCEPDPECHGSRCLTCVDAECAPTPQAGTLPSWDANADGQTEVDSGTRRRDAGAREPIGEVVDAGPVEPMEEPPVEPPKPPPAADAGTVVPRDAGQAMEEVALDECAPKPCLNGGTCIDGDESYRCECPATHSGLRCETNVDDCAGNPCAPGRCVDGLGTHSCSCGTGYVEVDGGCQPHFRNNGDGTVLDSATKITWQRDVPKNPPCNYPPTCTWSQATSYCAGLSLAGGGWRLPSKEEFATILDPSHGVPAIDPVAFPSTPPSNFWASDNYYATNPEAEGSREQAWTTDFGGGTSGWIGAGNNYHVRCARK